MKTNKGFAPIVIVLIIIAVLVVGGGAYYIGIKNSSVSTKTTEMTPAPNSDSTAISTPNPEPTLTPQPTADSPVGTNTTSSVPNIYSIVPAGCPLSGSGFSSVTGELCTNNRTSAKFGDTVYIYGVYLDPNDTIVTYSTIDNGRVLIPVIFISSTFISFVVPPNAGTGFHNIQITKKPDETPLFSNILTLNFTN